MPIEIKELVIRATVDSVNQHAGGNQVSSGNGGQMKALTDRVDELMKMIKEKNER